jgi:16S rRNA processing protein RimM
MESGSSSKSSTELRVGIVGRPHGTEGAFVVAEPTKRLELLAPGESVFVGGRERTVALRRGTPDRPIVSLQDIDTRDSMEHLRGAEITVPRDAVSLTAGEFLVDDLIGCDVFDGERRLGSVRDVLLMPSADVLEVQREGEADLLAPLVGDAVRAIDLAARRVEIDCHFLDAD